MLFLLPILSFSVSKWAEVGAAGRQHAAIAFGWYPTAGYTNQHMNHESLPHFTSPSLLSFCKTLENPKFQPSYFGAAASIWIPLALALPHGRDWLRLVENWNAKNNEIDTCEAAEEGEIKKVKWVRSRVEVHYLVEESNHCLLSNKNIFQQWVNHDYKLNHPPPPWGKKKLNNGERRLTKLGPRRPCFGVSRNYAFHFHPHSLKNHRSYLKLIQLWTLFGIGIFNLKLTL